MNTVRIHNWAVTVKCDSPSQTSLSYCATNDNQNSEPDIASFGQCGAPLGSGKLRHITNDLEQNYTVG
jgi:hypothetical protein